MNKIEKKEKSLIFIVHKQTGKILFQDRRNISKTGEEWGFFGGSLEQGESHRNAAIRELKEELNFEITQDFDYLGKISFEYSKEKHNRYMYIDFTEQNDFIDYEGDGAVFFTYQELLQLNLGPSDIASRLEIFEIYMRKKGYKI